VCKEEGKCLPNIFFYLRIIFFFLEYWVLEMEVNNYENFPNDHLGGVNTEIMKILCFKESRIEAS